MLNVAGKLPLDNPRRIFVLVVRLLKGKGDNETTFRFGPMVGFVFTDDNIRIIKPQDHW
jgi:hypothetical protein